MIYFCADDYGISDGTNRAIEDCLKNGVLNKISVLPNGKITDLEACFSAGAKVLSLHLNLIEGRPLSKPLDINILVDKNGFFKYSFIGLFLLTLSHKRKKVEEQLYKEIQSQIRFWKDKLGEEHIVSIDSHQHTHMIPLVLKVLMRVIKDEGVNVDYIRIPDEPVLPYVLTPSLYFSYTFSGITKQWLLKLLAVLNKKEVKKSKIKFSYFMGVLFSGKLDEIKLKKILPHYLKLAERKGKDIEVGFHPGDPENEQDLIAGSRKGFSKFYLSPWRKTEYDTLMNFKSDKFISE